MKLTTAITSEKMARTRAGLRLALVCLLSGVGAAAALSAGGEVIPSRLRPGRR
jgi:hypothetical protein